MSASLNPYPPVAWDQRAHHALGGGSYVFKDDYPGYIKRLVTKGVRVEVNIVIQPNSSPHIGTLASLGLAFVLARRLTDLDMEVLVRCDLWNNAKGEQLEVGGTQYQRGLADTGRFQKHLADYENILHILGRRYLVPYKMRLEEEFLAQPGIPAVLRGLIREREAIAKVLAPATGKLALRAPCPRCGLVEKHGLRNEYGESGDSVIFHCPLHGPYEYDVDKQASKFQFNCQLFNLVMGRFYEHAPYSWIEVCGSDYAGFWQEQLLWRFLDKAPIIVYTPLITDWSGLKVSKTLYLQETAYDYLRAAGLEYLINYKVSQREGRNFDRLWVEIESWVDEPFRLFRNYSLHYMHLTLSGIELQHGIIHLTTAFSSGSMPKAPFHMNSSSSDWPSDDDLEGT